MYGIALLYLCMYYICTKGFVQTFFVIRKNNDDDNSLIQRLLKGEKWKRKNLETPHMHNNNIRVYKKKNTNRERKHFFSYKINK